METREEKVLFSAVACFLVKDEQVLLGMKTQKIGKGCWNGYGGGIEEGETEREATVREFCEETGGVIIDPEHLEKIAIGYFYNKKSDGGTFVCAVHFYCAKEWEGEVKETEEMITPTWFKKNKLPLDTMMPTDKEWLPIALGGKNIIVRAYLSPFQEKSIAPVEIEYVDSLPEN